MIPTSVATSTLFSNCSNGDVRLTGGHSDSEGLVEICINNAWGTICDSNWDANDGDVVCKQLGFLPLGMYLDGNRVDSHI